VNLEYRKPNAKNNPYLNLLKLFLTVVALTVIIVFEVSLSIGKLYFIFVINFSGVFHKNISDWFQWSLVFVCFDPSKTKFVIIKLDVTSS
jgi:hypothetical protein